MDYFFKKYQDKWYIRDVAYEWVEREDVLGSESDLSNDTKSHEYRLHVESSEKG